MAGRPPESHSGTMTVQSQATQGPAAGYVEPSAPWDILYCHLKWIVGMGGMHIPDCLAAVGTWGSVAKWGTQS